MWDFVTKLDPNVVLTVLSGLGTVGGWLWSKIRGDQKQSLRDALWPIIEGNAIKLAENEFAIQVVRLKLERAAQEGLARMGLKPNRITTAIVQELVERGVTEVRNRILERRKLAALEAQLTGMLNKATDAGAAILKMPAQ